MSTGWYIVIRILTIVTKILLLGNKNILWRGDITTLGIDAIVNAANTTLLGGGGIDGAIHSKAGPNLLEECRRLRGCEVGQAKLTSAYKLPCKYIIHTVGPQDQNPAALASCYKECMKLAMAHNIRSLCFFCIATGVYGYPNDQAAEIAIKTIYDM